LGGLAGEFSRRPKQIQKQILDKEKTWVLKCNITGEDKISWIR
jgi:hypothetical protein